MSDRSDKTDKVELWLEKWMHSH